MTTNEVLLKNNTQFLFADHATDFGAAPATANNSLIIGVPTDVQIDLTGLAAGGGARESAKFDFGTPWASEIAFDACLEFETAPADGGVVVFWFAGSPSTTAAVGNYGGLTGVDAAFTDTTGNLGQLRLIGTLSLKNTVINIGHVGIILPTFQYGILLVVNHGSTALRSTVAAMDETHITATPVVTDIAAAA